MDIPVVITARLEEIELRLTEARKAIVHFEAERDSLRLAVDVLTKIPDGWKYVEGGAEVKVDQPTSTLVDPTRPWGAPVPLKYPYLSSPANTVVGQIERKILTTLRERGTIDRHTLAAAMGMKPDRVSIRLTALKKRHLVIHNRAEGLWSAA